MFDVAIIGAGVVGCAIARELTKYNLNICILEKENDVSCGASKANSGIVHGGYAAKYGTLKGELNAIGNRMYKKLDEELNFGYKETGALVLGFSEEDKLELEKLYENGIKNNTLGLKLLEGDEIFSLEPNLNRDVKYALYCSSVGVTSPYEMTIALAENAIANGASLLLKSKVVSIDNKKDSYSINLENGSNINSRFVINSAGAYSDKIANMVGDFSFKINHKRGQYVILDKMQGSLVNHVIFQVPTKLGKGILVTKTFHGNLMIGPNSEDIDSPENIDTTEDILTYIVDTARKSVPNFDMSKALTSYSGIRASSESGDFIIEESDVAKNFINLGGIESPGLTSSPAIAVKVLDILKSCGLKLIKNDTFNPYRSPIIVKKDSSFKGSTEDTDPEKHLICRCEKVTEAEIIDALKRGIPIESTDAIKRRTRAGMGFCQGNFCGPRVKSIIAKHNNVSIDKISTRGPGSSILPKRVPPKSI